MSESPTSLDRLHDVVLPPEVSWWPLAPGWYGVLGVVVVLVALLAYRAWRHWQANAYRRAALRALAAADNAAAMAEILRRTALATVLRSEVASRTGAAWVDWLDRQGGAAMPPVVRELLTTGVYGRAGGRHDLTPLREYAARWIRVHPSLPLGSESFRNSHD